MKALRKVKAGFVVAAGFMIWLVFCSTWSSCTPKMQVKWHQGRLDHHTAVLADLQERYPLLFELDTNGIFDTTIDKRKLEAYLKIIKDFDQLKIGKANKTLDSLNLLVAKQKDSLKNKGIKDCDPIIEYLERTVKVKGDQVIIYRDAPCKVQPISIDTMGIKFIVNESGLATVEVDSVHIRKEIDCPPRPKCDEKEWWDFWQSKLAVGIFFIMVFGLIFRRR